MFVLYTIVRKNIDGAAASAWEKVMVNRVEFAGTVLVVGIDTVKFPAVSCPVNEVIVDPGENPGPKVMVGTAAAGPCR